jgi:hypothetical protein
VIFVNNQDREVTFLGKALFSLLERKYFVFTREKSEYPICPVDQTMAKLREIASHIDEDRVIVCFGCRVFPDNIKGIEALAEKSPDQNLVLLKRLKGSKTWLILDNKLTFENERIADCGIFILKKSELVKSTQGNFNSYIRQLLVEGKLNPSFVDFWIFGNNQKAPTKRPMGRR